jgi:hypothetical protein
MKTASHTLNKIIPALTMLSEYFLL